ncbi:S-layer homology domain-containing protein [Fusibacter sp. 3D3]|uniref:S-layer homology domain-containing protein n=1 Tax=Fusibacter sp. 3D3 TaxID=1048380 RepID=UPI000852FFAC|nr:S-layer homology domain-containing protein [Fusibacter sp. 3D3]GAU78287.1 internalin-like protein [Fusibacter sp. 3D3]
MQKMHSKFLSILLTVCMIGSMLPTVVFAEEGSQNSGTSSSTSEITAFADLAEDVALQAVETSTTVDGLNLPSTLTVTVTTGSAMTATVSGDDMATDSEAQETETQEETTIEVSNWIANPDYNGDTAGDYTFTPTLDIQEGTTLADDVTPPQIKVTVKAADAPMLLRAGIQPLGTGTGIDITAKFTDANFLAEVRTVLGKEVNDRIYDTDDFDSVKYFSIGNKGIASLAGIEYFTALIGLNCISNELTELDVSKNVALTALSCNNNKLTALDVSKNTALIRLDCYSNQLTTLDVSNNTALTHLYCYNNQLTALDVSNNTALTTLDVSKNTALTELDVSNNIGLIELNCSNTQLIALDVSNNTALTGLNCSYNLLTALDVSNNAALAGLNCSYNLLTALDVSNNTALTLLYCYNNQLNILDVSNNTALTLLYCYNNQLNILDVSNNTGLTKLYCYNNQLTALDVSNNTALIRLDCYSNQLTALDVSNNTALTTLYCYNNYMPAESAVTGLDTNLTTIFAFDPQKSSYAVTVNSGTASQPTAAAGTTVTITANTPDNGKRFKEWTVVSGGVTLANEKALSTTFTMPANAVEVTATYENIPAGSTDITAKFTDANFLVEVRNALKKAVDEPIYDTDDLASIKRLNISNKNIESLAGIEYFTALAELYCNSNQLTELDVSKNTKLAVLSCSYNQLSALDVGNNTALTNLYCSNNYMPDKSAVKGLDTSLTTTFSFDPQKSRYAVTVNSGTASPATAEANAIVTITASPAPSGQLFKEWAVIIGGITLANSQMASTTFTMPANVVEVTATYENIPEGTTAVSGIALNKSSLSLYSNTSPNTAPLLATVTPANATDKSVTWQSSNEAVATVDASGNIKTAGNGTVTITVTTNDGGYTASCIVTVSTYSSGGGSSSGGNSDGGSSSSDRSSTTTTTTTTTATTTTTTTTTTEKKPNQPVTASAPITATTGTNGAASASIPDESISDAITKAQAEAKAQGKTTNAVSVALNVTMPNGATELTATLTRSSLNSLVSAGVTNLEINGSPVTVTFDQKALTEIQKKSSGNINITMAPKTDLSETAKKMIGIRPVYNITVSYGNSSTVSSFGNGVATVAIPYTPGNGEAIGGVYAVYVDEKGNAIRVDGSAYDVSSGCVIFTTPHFSMYGVGYTAPSAKFSDSNSHWAKESIDYVVGRGLLSGTTETTFAPDTAMTRGMLVTALGRLAGVDVSSYITSSFTDVKAGSAFQPYIEWAYKKGIIQGIGSNQFAPDRAIIREEIAVIISNFAKSTGYTLPVIREATTYSDASSIGSTYKTAVTALQQAGIMRGGTSNKFNPKSNATRAEVSSMLNGYIKLTIDPDTAQGWALNDAGQYLYFKDGKALTDTQPLDGVKYVFNTDGTLKTGWVKDGDNWRFYSGKTMVVGFWDLGAKGNNKTYYFAKDGLMVSGKWLETDGKWYYFNADGSLARSTKIDGYEVDENGVRKTK